MKKFFIGVGWGLALEIVFPLGVRSAVEHFKGYIGDWAAYVSTYPFWGMVLLCAYFIAAKKDYKTPFGVFAGFVLGFIIWNVLLWGI